MTGAAKAILADRSIRNVLPLAWTTVYELCLISDSELEHWFAQGKIRPTLTTREVVEARQDRRQKRPRNFAPTLTLPAPLPSATAPASDTLCATQMRARL